MRRHGADCAFAEVFTLDTECMVVAGAVVLPRDAGREFHQLRFREMLAQTIEESVRNFDWRLGHPIRVFENEALQLRKVGIGAVAR